MKKTTFTALTLVFILNPAWATEHHGGHIGGGTTGKNCLKPHLTDFKPVHLASVASGSEFSFIAQRIDKPESISVLVKNSPVALVSEFKDPHFLVKGKLPEGLRNTAARIQIKVQANGHYCAAENGWLLTITD